MMESQSVGDIALNVPGAAGVFATVTFGVGAGGSRAAGGETDAAVGVTCARIW